MTIEETIQSLKAKIKPLEERVAILKDRNKEVQKRLDSDVIIDMRFQNEIKDDKNEIQSNNLEIQEIEKEVRRLNRSLAILKSNR